MGLRNLGWLAAGSILQLLLAVGNCHAAPETQGNSTGSPEPAGETTSPDDETPRMNRLWNREPGIAFGEEDGQFFARAWLRGQFRYWEPFDSDPRTLAAMQSPAGSDFELRRSRIKLEGHLFDPRIAFYAERELRGDRPMLDLRLDIALRDNLSIRIGQHTV